MTSIRRIVIRDSEIDRPIIVSEMLREVMNIALAPGNAFYPPSDRYYAASRDNYRFTSITVPPDTLYRDPLETSYSGFYGWEAIDFLHIYTGELILNLSDGSIVTLRAGDMFVVNGSLQSCRNPGSVPVNVIAVTVYPD
jgi:mannose-6-phosphate isomerase-like protein (cupin superfamily)